MSALLTTERGRRGSRGLLAAFLAAASSFPACAKAESPPLTPGPAQVFVLEEKALEAFLLAHPLSTDGNLVVRVSRIGRTLARASDRPDLPFNFLVIEAAGFQGYSFPGGTVCLTRRLVQLLASDHELAFALGHELAHIVLRHHVTRVRFEQAMLAAGSGGASALSFYDRDAELESDRYGALYALRAGYDYSAATTALQRLDAAEESPSEDGSHPGYDDRIARFESYGREIKNCLAAFERGKSALQSGKADEAISMFTLFVAAFPRSVTGRVNLGASYLARLRAKAGTPQGLEEWVPFLPDAEVVLRGPIDQLDLDRAGDHFSEALKLHPEKAEARIGLALTRTREGLLDEARSLLLKVVEEAPARPEVALCLGNVDYLAERYDAAASRYREALTLRSGWPEANKNLALALEGAGKIDEARNLWKVLADDPRLGFEARHHLETPGGNRDGTTEP